MKIREYNKSTKYIKVRPLTMESFDKENLKGLPKDVIEVLKIKANKIPTSIVQEFFELSNILSIDEIILGMWRVYEIKVDRTWVSQQIVIMRKDNLIKERKDRSGIYEYMG